MSKKQVMKLQPVLHFGQCVKIHNKCYLQCLIKLIILKILMQLQANIERLKIDCHFTYQQHGKTGDMLNDVQVLRMKTITLILIHSSENTNLRERITVWVTPCFICLDSTDLLMFYALFLFNSHCPLSSVTRKKLPNVYKSCPKFISLEK